MILKTLMCIFGGFAIFSASTAQAQIRITEWMYTGNEDEFVELTNIGGAPIDMTGWSFDDADDVPGSFSLSDFGIVQPNEAVVISEQIAADFRMRWGLPLSVKVIGGNNQNLGRNDEIYIYDSANATVDQLRFGDQDFPGTIRTQDVSGQPGPGAIGADDVSLWVLSSVGDSFGSYASTAGDIGNPGNVPEPGTIGLALLAIVGLFASSRRRLQ
jgi:predicted extracellular nuclease